MYYQLIYVEQDIDLEDFILEKKMQTLEEIKEENGKESTYHSSYEVFIYQNIISLHITFYVYSGGAHDIRYDQVFYYDLEHKREIFVEDLLKLNEDFLQTISKLAEEQLKEMKKEMIYDDAFLLEEGIKPVKENYRYLMFEEDQLQIIFPPYQVGPWSSGAITVQIPYFKIAKYLML